MMKKMYSEISHRLKVPWGNENGKHIAGPGYLCDSKDRRLFSCYITISPKKENTQEEGFIHVCADVENRLANRRDLPFL